MIALDETPLYVEFSAPAIVNVLGYVAREDAETSISYIQPSLDDMAQQIWQGAAHMGSAIGLLSKQDDHVYPVTVHVFITARTIDGPIARLAWVLVGLWFLLLFGGTLIFFRPTFGNSLNSYVTARLLVEDSALVGGHCCGTLDENMKMGAKFETAGDSRFEESLGHVAPGAEGALNANREYAGTHGEH